MALPFSAQNQILTGQPWDVVAGSEGEWGSWGGHCVMCPGYNEQGPVCVTWGRKQQMTWAFFDEYCDEAYAIVTEKNIVNAAPGINLEALEQALQEVTSA
jgi:hypothetical protein